MTDREYSVVAAAGRDAFHSELGICDCPYDSRLEPDEHRAWVRGYVEAEVEMYAHA